MTQKYTLTFVYPNDDLSLGTFTCDTTVKSPIYDKTDKKWVLDGLIRQLHCHKRIYSPNLIEATLRIFHTPSYQGTEGENDYLTVTSLRTIFECALVSMTTTYEDKANGVTLQDTTIASNYFVYQVTPIFRQEGVSGTESGYAEVRLVMYSMDKLFDITANSRSYVGMRLGNDILQDAAAIYTVSDLLAPRVNYDHLQFLAMDDDKGAEAFQPFLVQYNETFYTMLARTANRCGEYLYFENGQLNLGLQQQATPIETTCKTKDTDKLLLSSIEYPSKTVNPFEPLTYRYQRNPQLSLKNDHDDTQLSVSINSYGSLPAKSSIQKMEDDIFALKFSIDNACPTAYPADDTEHTDEEKKARLWDIKLWPWKNALNTLITEWNTTSSKAKDAKDAYQNIDNIRELPIRIQQAEYTIQKLENEIAEATDSNEIAVKDAQKKKEEEKRDALKEQLDAYPKDKDGNPDASSYIKTVSSYWEGAKKFVDEKLKTSDYYKLQSVATDEDVKSYVGHTEYKREISKIEALYDNIPLSSSSKQPSTKTQTGRLVTDFIPGADDYFGVGIAAKGTYTDMDGCLSPKGTLTGSVKNAPKSGPNYSEHSYWVTLLGKLLKTSKPLASLIFDIAVAEGEACLLALEQAAIANDTYHEYFYTDDSDRVKWSTPHEAMQPYRYTETTKDGKTVKTNLFCNAASLPSHTFSKHSYNTFSKDESTGEYKYSTEYTVLKSDFYKVVSKLQSLISNEQIVMHVRTADNTKVVLLGDTVKENDSTYIVVEDESTFEADAAQEFRQRLVAVPLVEDVVMPPTCPQGHHGTTGPQTGIVIENFDPGKQGRVRVQFNWQREESDDKYKKPTPYIRVSTIHATSGKGGFYFRPRVGDEVMLCFEHDNPERPYVAASLFNKDNTPLVGSAHSPNTSLIATHNGHCINMTDENNIEFLGPILKVPFLGATLATDSSNNHFCDCIDGNFAGGITIADFMGLYKISASATNRNITVSSPLGDVKIDAFTGITIEAPHGDIKISGKNVTIEARNNVTITSGKAAKEARDGLKKTQIGGLLDSVKGLIKKYTSPDLALIRCVIERFLEPIEGTTLIKSTNYLMLEAGSGKTSYQSKSLNPVDYDKLSDKEREQLSTPQVIDYLIKQAYNIVISDLDDWCKVQMLAQESVSVYALLLNDTRNNETFKALLKDNGDCESDKVVEWVASFRNELRDADISNKISTLFRTIDELYIDNKELEQIIGNQRRILCQAFLKVCRHAHQLFKLTFTLTSSNTGDKWTKQLKTSHKAYYKSVNNATLMTKWKDDYEGAMGSIKDFFLRYIGEKKGIEVINSDNTILADKKLIFRTIAYGFLTFQKDFKYDKDVAGQTLNNISPDTKLKIPQGIADNAADLANSIFAQPALDMELSQQDLLNDAKWTAWVTGWYLDPKPEDKSFMEKLKDAALDGVTEEYTKTWKTITAKGRTAVNARESGTILMSSAKGYMQTLRGKQWKMISNDESIDALKKMLLEAH